MLGERSSRPSLAASLHRLPPRRSGKARSCALATRATRFATSRCGWAGRGVAGRHPGRHRATRVWGRARNPEPDLHRAQV